MNKKLIGVFMTALLAIVLTVSLGYFLFDQSNQPSDTVPNSPSPEPTHPPQSDYTFTVYRWQNGSVTLSMLQEYAMWRMTVAMPLLFTYRLNNTSGMAAYWHRGAEGFTVVSSQFEADLTRVTEKWTKTNETVMVPVSLYGTTDHPEYAYLFP